MFEHAATFQGGDVSGNLRLGKIEALYQELFAEVISDGLITTDERAQLDKMADSLGLDRQRLQQLEDALEAAYRAEQRSLGSEEHVAVDIDVSDLADADAAAPAAAPGDPHALFQRYASQGDVDAAWCVAHALVHANAANVDERACFEKYANDLLVRPQRALNREAWHELLFHEDEDPRIGAIFGAVAPAVLLGRLSAMRRDKQLPTLDPSKRQDPVLSTVQAVRCVAWGSAILGMASPAIHVDPDREGTAEWVVALPPAVRLGARALSGRTSEELAFLAGMHLAYLREEHFVAILAPSLANLEEIFLAALTIGKPDLPLREDARALIVPIARAIEPLLDPGTLDRLRGHVLAFIADGGRADLRRWLSAVERTAVRAGLLLGNDLRAARAILELEGRSDIHSKMDDLLSFATSERYIQLRRRTGITIDSRME